MKVYCILGKPADFTSAFLPWESIYEKTLWRAGEMYPPHVKSDGPMDTINQLTDVVEGSSEMSYTIQSNQANDPMLFVTRRTFSSDLNKRR